MAKWTRDYLTGTIICAICGAPRNHREECCKTAPYIPFAEFMAAYFPGSTTDRSQAPDDDHYVPIAIAREFYDDYLSSECKDLQAYINQTTGLY